MGSGVFHIERSSGLLAGKTDLAIEEAGLLNEGGFAYYTPFVYEGKLLGVKFFKGTRMATSAFETARKRANEEYSLLLTLGGANGHAPKAFAVGTYTREEGGDRATFAAVIEEHVAFRNLSETISLLEPGKQARMSCSAKTALLIGQAVAEACINCKDERGIAIPHRDLNEANVRFEVKGEAVRCVLIDFGQATEADRHEVTPTLEVRLAGLYVGAPEVFDPHNPARNLPSVDVWSVGAIMHFVRTGTWPFERQLSGVSKASGGGVSLQGIAEIALIKERPVDLLAQLRTNGEEASRADIELASIIADCTKPKTSFDRVTDCRVEMNGLLRSLHLALRAYYPGAETLHFASYGQAVTTTDAEAERTPDIVGTPDLASLEIDSSLPEPKNAEQETPAKVATGTISVLKKVGFGLGCAASTLLALFMIMSAMTYIYIRVDWNAVFEGSSGEAIAAIIMTVFIGAFYIFLAYLLFRLARTCFRKLRRKGGAQESEK